MQPKITFDDKIFYDTATHFNDKGMYLPIDIIYEEGGLFTSDSYG